MPWSDKEKRREYDRLRNKLPHRREYDKERNQTETRKQREKDRATQRRQYKVTKQKEYKKATKNEFPLYGRATRIRTRCKKSGVACDISDTFLRELYKSQGMMCAVTGLPFDERPHMRASIDRIKPQFGYIAGNVRIILSCINSLKVDDNSDEWVFTTAQAILNGPLSDSLGSKIQSDNRVLLPE